MPVSVLLVEGELDAETLNPLLRSQGIQTTAEHVGEKSALKPRALHLREPPRAGQQGVAACYLRDRDFDYDPPTDRSRPTADSGYGWRWCRHELENYLLEPRIVAAAAGWSEPEYSAELLKAAQHLKHYTSARWTVGVTRRGLPPTRELANRPQDLGNEIKIPTDCSQAACFGWARSHVDSFRTQLDKALAPSTIDASLTERSTQLAAITSVEEVLVWHSGKELLAALAPTLARRPENNPKAFRRRLHTWVRDNPEATLALLPEWQALLTLLQA